MATQAPTMQELVDLGVAEAQAQRTELTFQSNDVALMEQEGAAAMGDHLTAYAIKRFRDRFLDGASGDALTEYCDDVYGIQKAQPIAAAGKMTFNRADPANGAQTLLAGFVVGTDKDASGKEKLYILDGDVSWPAAPDPSSVGDRTIDVIAVVAGSDGNITTTNKVTRFISENPDPNIVIASSTVMSGGDDEEGDDDLRARCRSIFSTLARATLDAIEAGALKEVPEVKRASVVEDSTGMMVLYVSDINGGSNDRMIANVRAAMRTWRAGGAMLSIAGGQLFTQPITLALTLAAGAASSPTLLANVKLAIVAAVKKLKIGETLYLDLIRAAAKSVDPDNIKKVNVTVPVGDVEPVSPNQLIRTTTADITFG